MYDFMFIINFASFHLHTKCRPMWGIDKYVPAQTAAASVSKPKTNSHLCSIPELINCEKL